eukprot:5350990-Pyramimonas_sp.AAC.2
MTPVPRPAAADGFSRQALHRRWISRHCNIYNPSAVHTYITPVLQIQPLCGASPQVPCKPPRWHRARAMQCAHARGDQGSTRLVPTPTPKSTSTSTPTPTPRPRSRARHGHCRMDR